MPVCGSAAGLPLKIRFAPKDSAGGSGLAGAERGKVNLGVLSLRLKIWPSFTQFARVAPQIGPPRHWPAEFRAGQKKNVVGNDLSPKRRSRAQGARKLYYPTRSTDCARSRCIWCHFGHKRRRLPRSLQGPRISISRSRAGHTHLGHITVEAIDYGTEEITPYCSAAGSMRQGREPSF